MWQFCTLVLRISFGYFFRVNGTDEHVLVEERTVEIYWDLSRFNDFKKIYWDLSRFNDF